MLKRLVAILATIAIAFSLPPAVGTQKGLSQVMVDKLRHSQGLFQGIALADYPKIISSAESLLALSKTAEWANNAPRYEMYNNNFQVAVQGVIEKAKEKNIDGVVLAFQDVTKSCVRCHRYLREIRDAR